MPRQNSYPTSTLGYNRDSSFIFGRGLTIDTQIHGYILTGQNTTIVSNGNSGLIVCGRDARWQSGSTYGNVILGENSKIENIGNFGNIIAAYGLTFNTSDRNHNNYCNLIAGGWSTYTGNGQLFGNIILGRETTIQCGLSGNIMAGSGLKIDNYYTYSNIITEENLKLSERFVGIMRTWIVGGFSDDSKPLSSIKNYGLIFDASNANNANKNPGNNPDYRYKIHYPNVQNCAALLDGYKQYSENMTIMDKDGNTIVENGKLKLEEEVAVLKQEIAELKQLIAENALSK